MNNGNDITTKSIISHQLTYVCRNQSAWHLEWHCFVRMLLSNRVLYSSNRTRIHGGNNFHHVFLFFPKYLYTVFMRLWISYFSNMKYLQNIHYNTIWDIYIIETNKFRIYYIFFAFIVSYLSQNFIFYYYIK